MPLWKTRPVSEEPEIELLRWSVFETNDGQRHFVGAMSGSRGRVSSAVVELDVTSRRGVTKTGRRYVLVGEPGFDLNAAYTWCAWMDINEIDSESVRNVTFELFGRSEFN